MRKIHYVVTDHCTESRYKINTQFYGDDELSKSFIAQECAEDYWDNRDGYEDSWPLNFKLYDSEKAIEPFFECLVGVQFKPDFTVYNPKNKEQADASE